MLKKETIDSILISLKNHNSDLPIEKTFDLLEKIVSYNSNNNELDGIKFNWETALNIIYNEDTSFSQAKSVANFIFNVEPILKKILYLIDKNEYNRMVSCKEGLYPLMRFLKIDPHFRNSHQTDFKIAYELRNLTSHQAADYPRDIFYTNIEACLVTVLCAINNNCKQLLSVNYYSSSINVTNYMNELIESFKVKNKKYINLDGSEDVKSINTLVVEDLDDLNSIDDIEDTGYRESRKGEIDYLRKNSIPEKKMLILAEAGMGKTTTIEYLAYCDAKDRINDNSKKIPVLLYLNLLIDPKLTIEDYIAKKLEIDVNQVKNLLVHGEINLFLDGVNEIPNISDLKTARLLEINSIINLYGDTFIIISTRPQTNNLIHRIPKFNLLSMDDDKQSLFVERNCKDLDSRKLILKAISENDKIRRVVRTPLFLNIFVKVVVATKKIPTSEGNLIKVFINSLFEREIKEKNNLYFDIKKGNYLLRAFAYSAKEKYKANSGVIESEIVDCFCEKMKNCGFTVDVLDYLSIFIDLGLLSHKDDLYCFYHESYQDFFYSEELRFVLGI